MSSHQNSVTPKVFLSPFVLSTVMLDNSNSPGDQEGFLLGKTYKSVRFEINDQSMCNTEEDLLISVFSAYPCGDFLTFYNSKGEIDTEFIKNFLGDRINSVIGWYRFRRNVPPYPSAREAIVQKHLMNFFAGNLVIGDNYFVYGVFGSSTSESCSTHTYDYAFYIERPDRFLPLTMSMLNLIDTKTKYRSGSLASSFVNSQSFDSVLNISWSFESCWQTEDGIQQMHKLLRDKCSSLAEELTASECVNASIEEDIMRLEGELESLAMSEKQFSSESDEVEDTNDDQENISPKDESENVRHSRKRSWSELVDFEKEKRHPVYGRYFEQNRAIEQESISQASGEASDGGYVPPPQKKLKVLEEHKRVIDHDYSSASDEDSHKYAQEADDDAGDDDGGDDDDQGDEDQGDEDQGDDDQGDDDRGDELDGVSLPSETEDYASTDDSKSVHDVEVEVPSCNTVTEDFDTVKSQFQDNQKNVPNMQKRVSTENPGVEKMSLLENIPPVEQGSIATKIFSFAENTGPVSEEVVVTSQNIPIKSNTDLQTFEYSVQERFDVGSEYIPISSDEQDEDNVENNDNQIHEEDFSQTLHPDDKEGLKKGVEFDNSNSSNSNH